MPDAFTLRIFVPDGDPEGVRFIDRMNWTGLGIVFPRSKWPESQEPGGVRSNGRLYPDWLQRRRRGPPDGVRGSGGRREEPY